MSWFSEEPEPVHAVEDYSYFFKTPQTTHCGIDLVARNRKGLPPLELVRVEDEDEITCEDCLEDLRPGGFFRWLWRTLFG
jgi:hypothetical protein